MFQQIMDTCKYVYVICTVLTFLQYMLHYLNTRQEGCKPTDHCSRLLSNFFCEEAPDIYLYSKFQLYLLQQKASQFWMRRQEISGCVYDYKTSYVKPKHYLFLTLTKFLHKNLTRL